MKMLMHCLECKILSLFIFYYSLMSYYCSYYIYVHVHIYFQLLFHLNRYYGCYFCYTRLHTDFIETVMNLSLGLVSICFSQRHCFGFKVKGVAELQGLFLF